MIKVGECYEAILFEGIDEIPNNDLKFTFKIVASQTIDDKTFYLGAKILPDSDNFSVSHHGATQWFDECGEPLDEVNKSFDLWFELVID